MHEALSPLSRILHNAVINYEVLFVKQNVFLFHGPTAAIETGPPLYRGRVLRLTQIPLPDHTRHSQNTDMHAPDGIQTRNLRKRADVDPRLRPRGRWYRQAKRVQNERSVS